GRPPRAPFPPLSIRRLERAPGAQGIARAPRARRRCGGCGPGRAGRDPAAGSAAASGCSRRNTRARREDRARRGVEGGPARALAARRVATGGYESPVPRRSAIGFAPDRGGALAGVLLGLRRVLAPRLSRRVGAAGEEGLHGAAEGEKAVTDGV